MTGSEVPALALAPYERTSERHATPEGRQNTLHDM